MNEILTLSGLILSFLSTLIIVKDYLFHNSDKIKKQAHDQALCYYEEDIEMGVGYKSIITSILQTQHSFIMLALGFAFQLISEVFKLYEIDIMVTRNLLIILISVLISVVTYLLIELKIKKTLKQILK